jgi:hypothetical protein
LKIVFRVRKPLVLGLYQKGIGAPKEPPITEISKP